MCGLTSQNGDFSGTSLSNVAFGTGFLPASLTQSIGNIGNAINQGLSTAGNSMNNADKIMLDDATGATGATQNANRAADAQNQLIANNNQDQENSEDAASTRAAALRSAANQSASSKVGFNSAPSASILGVSTIYNPSNPNTLGA